MANPPPTKPVNQVPDHVRQIVNDKNRQAGNKPSISSAFRPVAVQTPKPKRFP